jgi:uncharacterized protein (DUF3820 family)
MEDLVEADGMRGTPESIAEWLALTGVDPAEAITTPVNRLARRVHEPRRPKPRKPAGPRKSRPGANTEPTAAPATKEDKAIAAFERLIVPWGKHKGSRWGDVPLDFLTWFAGLDDPKAPGAVALQVRVREYLDLKYGLNPGRLF